MLEKYKLIIFDCDGTLVDSERLANRLISDMMNELEIPMDEDKSMRLFKGTHFQKITDYVRSKITEELDFDFEQRYRERCKTLFEKELEEISGASEFIKKLQIDFCVASNGPRIKMKTSLSVTALDKLIPDDHIYSAYDIKKFKPEPDLFLFAARSFGVKPEECLVIEDTIPGIEAAKSASMDVWGIYHEGVNDEILSYGIPTFKDFNEINF